MAMAAIVELPWALDVPSPAATSDVSRPVAHADDHGVLMHGVVFGLGISLPLWLGFAWLATSLAAVVFGT